MTDEQKRRFDALSDLRGSFWANYEGRRDFEWKVSFGIWTALATLTGISLTDKIAVQGSPLAVGACARACGAPDTCVLGMECGESERRKSG